MYGYLQSNFQYPHTINCVIKDLKQLVDEAFENIVEKAKKIALDWPIFFSRIDDSHCDRNHSSLTAIRFFDNG